jgi:16S rRNA (uracil1498-N3)-methyltransferase
MHLFYTPLLKVGMPSFLLDEMESKHAVRVLRLAKGDQVLLVNGSGDRFVAEIQDDNPKRVILSIIQHTTDFGKRNYSTHIAVAPTKNMDRMEWFVEKATEIGVDEITPIICDRSERKEVKADRLEKIAISAMKQSLKAYLPKINSAVKFTTFIKELSNNGATSTKRFIAHCEEDEKTFLNASVVPSESVIILIGPEGDFSPEELKLAKNANFLALSLGESRLRTETAALMVCAEMALINRK